MFVQARPVIGILCKPCIILCCGFWIEIPSFTEIENIITDGPLHTTRWWSPSRACKGKQKYDLMQMNSNFKGFWTSYLKLSLSVWSIPSPCINEHMRTLYVKYVKWTVYYTCILCVGTHFHKYYKQTHHVRQQSFSTIVNNAILKI